MMLKSLFTIHQHKGPICQTMELSPELSNIFAKRAAKSSDEVDIYANYTTKLQERFKSHKSAYEDLNAAATSRIMRILSTRLMSYEREERGIAAVIHGDPVFSNAILDERSKNVFFFDMRGQQGNQLTPIGDLNYDLGKVLQSLQGYDHVVVADDSLLESFGDPESALNAIIQPEDRQLLLKLQNEIFWPFVAEEYGGRVQRQDLLDITASLLFSLIPLHKKSVQPVFLKMCENVMEYGFACPLPEVVD